MPVFESGAILLHLAERSRAVHADRRRRGRKEMLEWLFWQVGNLGPMAGQLSHFVNYAQGEHPYSHKRYADEYNRCLGVLERRLEGRDFILDEYSIADMAIWPWVLIAKPLGQPLDDFPNVARWREAIKQRPAVQRGVDLGKDLRRSRAADRGRTADPVQPDGARGSRSVPVDTVACFRDLSVSSLCRRCRPARSAAKRRAEQGGAS